MGYNMKLYFLVAINLMLISGCASSVRNTANLAETSPANEISSDEAVFDEFEKELSQREVNVPDPIEPWNRLMFGVNDGFYFWVAKPITQTYEKITPQPARMGIRNFFNNLATPVRLVNCLLQGKNAAAGTELKRFAINTTAGILGFGDPAKDKYKIESVREDLGQTLGKYGLKDGFYLVLPVLGPSSARDAAGTVGDLFLNPLFYVEPTEAAVGISVGKNINEGSFHLGDYEAFKEASVDPYVAMRQAYIQYRARQIEE